MEGRVGWGGGDLSCAVFMNTAEAHARPLLLSIWSIGIVCS